MLLETSKTSALLFLETIRRLFAPSIKVCFQILIRSVSALGDLSAKSANALGDFKEASASALESSSAYLSTVSSKGASYLGIFHTSSFINFARFSPLVQEHFSLCSPHFYRN